MKLTIKALIVDDHFLFREVVHKTLRHIGIEQIIIAHDGTAALTMIESSIRNNDPFNIVFLDESMPGMHGMDLVLRIRESRIYDHSAIVMISAETSHRIILQAINTGVSAYLLKPISPAALTDRVGILLDRLATGHLFRNPQSNTIAQGGTADADLSDIP